MDQLETKQSEELDSQMSFLDHLDELRKRLVNSVIIVVIAFVFCFYFSSNIFNFLSVPIRRALSEAERRDLPVKGVTGDEKIVPLSSLKEGDKGLYVFDRVTKLGVSVIAPGTSVEAVVGNDSEGVAALIWDSNAARYVTRSVDVGVERPVESR